MMLKWFRLFLLSSRQTRRIANRSVESKIPMTSSMISTGKAGNLEDIALVSGASCRSHKMGSCCENSHFRVYVFTAFVRGA